MRPLALNGELPNVSILSMLANLGTHKNNKATTPSRAVVTGQPATTMVKEMSRQQARISMC